jgi:hypothetical protein
VLTNIPYAQRPNQGIDHSVGQDVRIGMTFQPEGMGNLNAPEDQRAPFNQAVYIISMTDSEQGDSLNYSTIGPNNCSQ